jgi:MFS family permease
VDRSNVAFAKLQFSAELGFDDVIFGIGATIFTVGYLAFEVPSNIVLQRIGMRRTLLRIMVAWGLCCAAHALMTASWQFYGLRFLLGVAEAGFFPGVLFYLTRWSPMERRARLIALFMLSVPVSGLLSGLISGAIMNSMDGVASLSGWQWLFIIEGLPSVLIGVWAFLSLPETPADARWLDSQEKAIILADLAADVARQPEPPGRWRTVLGVPAFWTLALASVAIFTSTANFFFWLPTIVRNAGEQDVLTVGLYSAIPFLFGAIAQYGIARRSDRTQERRLHVAIPFAVGGLGWLLAGWWNAEPGLAVAAMTLAIAGTFGAFGPFWSLPGTVFRGSQVAVGIAIVTTIGSLGGAVSPSLVGYISVETGSLVGAQLYFAALMLVSAGAIALTVGKPTRRKDVGQRELQDQGPAANGMEQSVRST